MVKVNLPLLEVSGADYGDDEAAMVDYRADGTARAMAMDNRGPIRYDANGKLHPDILDAYSRAGFYVFEDVLGEAERADLERDVADILDRAPVAKDAKLDKHRNILSFFFVRSMISRGYINMLHIKTKYNFVDILTKHWGYQGTYYELILPIFHHVGNRAALFLDDTLEVDVSINVEENMKFGILGSERTLSQPQSGALVVGQTEIQI